MTDTTTIPAPSGIDQPRRKLIERMAATAGLEPAAFYSAIQSSCGCEGATKESFAVLLMAAEKYQLNPMLRQLFLMKTKKGIEVVIPVDGWIPLLVAHQDYLAHEVVMTWEGEQFKSKPVAATCRIWTRNRAALGLGPFEHTDRKSTRLNSSHRL